MSLSAPFIKRPVATSLMAAAFFVLGVVAYFLLPVAALPQVDFPTIQVQANLPGASPETMASNVAQPLERQFSLIAGITQMTSTSQLSQTKVVLQFDLSRNIDSAAQDVLAAINAASGQLPTNLPSAPSIYKANPADTAIITMGVSSDVLPMRTVSDYADNILSQQISRLPGVGQVQILGQQKPAIRVQIDPRKAAAMGLQLETIRTQLAATTANAPKGSLVGPNTTSAVYANDQLTDARTWNNLIVGYKNGAPIRVRDLGRAIQDVENNQIGAFNFPGKANTDPNAPSGQGLILQVFKQPGANVIQTVAGIKAALPGLQADIPPSIRLSILQDRTQTIKASVLDVEVTMLITILLVVGVIFVFLRNIRATLIPSAVIPLSLLATCAAMLALHFSLDNLSLMALTIAVGFVVDDAIVVVEVIWKRIEEGEQPLEAALAGAGEIGFTILTISISLIAVFTPLMFMGGIIGRLMREFAFTVSVAVALSVFLSLTFTPMLCGKFLKKPEHSRNRIMIALETGFQKIESGYARALTVVMRHMGLTLAVFIGTAALALWLYATVPAGFFPLQDTGFLTGQMITAQRESTQSAQRKAEQWAKIAAQDPDVTWVTYALTGGNVVIVSLALKPQDEGRTASADQILARLRPKFSKVVGAPVFMAPNQDINVGGRGGRALYQYTLSDADLDELNLWAPKLLTALKALPQLKDVNSDQQSTASAVKMTIDRDAAARFGISPTDIDAAVYDQLGQHQIAQTFTQLNSYHVVMEAPPSLQATPDLFNSVYINSPVTGKGVPLSLFLKYDPTATASLTINHQGQFPAATISFNLAPGVPLGDATKLVEDARARLGAPQTLTGTFQGNAAAFQDSLSSEPILILAALLAVYVVLGMLYESYIHPLTILSTLPSAGLGALLALLAAGQDLNVIGIIAIILLIGIVKKNGIMVVDVALKLERDHGMSPVDAVTEACHQRLRPILMTTACAMFSGVPMALGHGTGSEFRQPLGYAIIGGLLVSQVLTLFTTPVVYVYLDRLRHLFDKKEPMPGSGLPVSVPAE
jgi:HAE1 family hydrophobic/amphiphilic exporter-1